MEHAPVRWGILGPGNIARTFTEDLRLLAGHVVAAAASRDATRAASFAAEYKIARSYGSYEDLAADASLDVIYIATPHPGITPRRGCAWRPGARCWWKSRSRSPRRRRRT